MCLLLSVACSDVKLEPIPETVVDRDDKLEIKGSLCTRSPQSLQFPLRVLFIVDSSESMAVTDPPDPETEETGRERAVRETWEGLLAVPGADVKISIIRFSSGAKVQTLTEDGKAYTDDPALLGTATQALQFTDFSTNYRQALKEARETIKDEMVETELESRARSRYVVVFLSDGIPDSGTTDGKQDILDDIVQITELEEVFGVGSLEFHTAYVSSGFTPAADAPAQKLLQEMAETGGGSYRSFPNGEEINFLFVDFSVLERVYTLKTLAAINMNAVSFTPQGLVDLSGTFDPAAFVDQDGDDKPTCGELLVDSDMDGLADLRELEAGTDPLDRDTDHDGLSDRVEVEQGNGEDDNGPDPLDPSDSGCYAKVACEGDACGCIDFDADGVCDCDDADADGQCDYVDGDGDQLPDCEEVYLGTSPNGADTDADGVPDLLETRFGTSASTVDHLGDLDFDSTSNALEVFTGTDPLCPDSAFRSEVAFRYQLDSHGLSADENVCYDFRISNITLMPTLETGWNRILIFAGEVAFDAPDSFADYRIACVEARYRIDDAGRPAQVEYKEPSSGRFSLTEADFVPAQDFDPAVNCSRP